MTPTARASPKAVSGNQKLHHAMGHDQNRRLKRMFADLAMQNELLKEALGKK